MSYLSCALGSLLIGSLPVAGNLRAEDAVRLGAVFVADVETPPLPAANPLRGFRSTSAGHTATVVPAAEPVAPAAPPAPSPLPVADEGAIELPPLPRPNPLRGARPRQTVARATETSLTLPAVAPMPTAAAPGVAPAHALAPLLNDTVSDIDLTLLRESVEHAQKGRHAEAAATRSRIDDPIARKLAWWYELRRNDEPADPFELERFRAANADWPGGSLLQRLGETVLYERNADARTILAYYASAKPTTGLGRFLLARARQQTGDTAAAAALAREAWWSDTFGPRSEADFLAEFGGVLRTEDHLKRADTFLYKDRRQLLPNVERVLPYLGRDDQLRLRLRLDVAQHKLAAAEKQFARLGEAALRDPGLLLARIQLARRKKDFQRAWQLLARAPQDAASMGSPAAWWAERRLQVRLALAEGQSQTAYDLAARHGELSGDALVEAESLAGWIALSRLHKPALAERHLTTMERTATEDQDQAKAAYWLGRARLAQQDKIGAINHFALAAKHQFHFYGQLALQRLDAAGLKLQEQPLQPSDDDIRRFTGRDAVRALIIAYRAQLDGIPGLFFNQLAWRLSTPGEMTLLAELAAQLRSPNGSVITGKVGIHRGFALDRYAYPVNALPAYDRLTPEVDKSFLLALARQESEFNADARSAVGARGMMQIMPATAKLIARQHGVTYSRDRLDSDPSYNVALGVAHIHDLIQQYNGSYVLTLVAYNAGPGRVRQWIDTFGDPRAREVDAVDWVEAIPFDETRRYVQRILASKQVFQHRLRNGGGAVRLVQDLKRGTPQEVHKADADEAMRAVAADN